MSRILPRTEIKVSEVSVVKAYLMHKFKKKESISPVCTKHFIFFSSRILFDDFQLLAQ